MFTVDAALQQTCIQFRDQASRGHITDAERDLLIDGAILLAVQLEGMVQDAKAEAHPFLLHAAPGHGPGRHRAAIAA
ncbi:MAG TPA: hypothetical protein VF506_13185 [Streptosporangiaceae bacterium]